jgi:hypothetical protein
MTVTINGTTGITSVNGPAAAPSVTGADTDTGIVYGTNTLSLATGGTTAVTVDSSQNVGIGTSSPGYKLDVSATSFIAASVSTSYSGAANIRIADASTTSASAPYVGSVGNNLTFGRLGTAEYVRIDSSGNLLVGKTTTATTSLGWSFGSDRGNAKFSAGNYMIFNRDDNDILVNFRRSDSSVGTITVNATNTAYNTSSDYRLKNTIAPMTGALAKVAALKPCTYKWNIDGSDGEGFIAHELAEVVPGCVSGEKDAVDTDGNPKYQGIDTSFLVATLTAAIQELKAIVDAQGAEIAALKGTQA